MAQISIDDLSIRFRGPMLLDGVSARVESADRIGLLGRNGAGKTTLLRILDGEVQPDSGTVSLAPSTRIARLRQDVPDHQPGTVRSVVVSGQLDDVDPEQAWQIEHSVERTLSQMGLSGEADFQTLSSGMKRRVLLARSIARQPDVLLLDEPTNHLDIESILWLEDFLRRWPATLVFITHDRSFLQNLATRIWEIDRGKLFDWTCDYETFLKRKQQAIEAEEKQNALFDKRLAQEEAWIRQGIKARRTRNEGRVKALQAMRSERSQRRSSVGTAKLNLQQAERSGTLVAEAKEITFAYDGPPVVEQFSTTLMRGDKVGIIGPNGAGKSTLLKLLLGELKPQHGTVRLGTNLQIAYFDQLRASLDPDKTVWENVGDGRENVRVGEKTKHILGYLQDFLFAPERARTEVRFLSGGERNRALLARLMAQPANIIVLDEPTNDLDSETLELLEEQLIDFSGTVLMVSHDRTFLNNVVTSTIVFEQDGIREYVGGYDEWQAAVQRREREAKPVAAVRHPKEPSTDNNRMKTDAGSSGGATAGKPKKLSFNQQRELEQLPGRIESLEAEIDQLHQQMADPEFYRSDGQEIAAKSAELARLEQELAEAFERWEELEG